MEKDILGKNILPLKTKKLYLLDMDGTIYLGNVLFDGVKELLKSIKDRGDKYVFITNNSSKSVADYVKKVSAFGIEVDESNFFTSTQAASMLFKNKFGNDLIYAQGTKSFVEELIKSGLNVTTEYSKNTKAVLVGFDPEITGKKLENTCKTLNLDVPYYATNPDWVCPTEFGYVPDCGSMCFGLEKATGKAPIFIGKPQPQMIYSAMELNGARKDETVVIGDRIYTDIASGVNAGVDTILVLSGEATIKDYNESEIKPTFLLDSIKDLL